MASFSFLKFYLAQQLIGFNLSLHTLNEKNNAIGRRYSTEAKPRQEEKVIKGNKYRKGYIVALITAAGK